MSIEPSLSFAGLLFSAFALGFTVFSAALLKYNRLLRNRYQPRPAERGSARSLRLTTGPDAVPQDLPYPIVSIVVHGDGIRPWLNFQSPGQMIEPGALQAGGQTADGFEQRWQALSRPGVRSTENSSPAMQWQSSLHSAIPLELS